MYNKNKNKKQHNSVLNNINTNDLSNIDNKENLKENNSENRKYTKQSKYDNVNIPTEIQINHITINKLSNHEPSDKQLYISPLKNLKKLHQAVNFAAENHKNKNDIKKDNNEHINKTIILKNNRKIKNKNKPNSARSFVEDSTENTNNNQNKYDLVYTETKNY